MQLTLRAQGLVCKLVVLGGRGAGPLIAALAADLYQPGVFTVDAGGPRLLLRAEGGAGVLPVLTCAQTPTVGFKLLPILVCLTLHVTRLGVLSCGEKYCLCKLGEISFV